MSDNEGLGELVREMDARPLMENDELALVYFQSKHITFATSFLPPGTRSNVDPGHVGAHEVAYVFEGELVLELGDNRDAVRLTAGDAYLIEEGVSHTAFNPGVIRAGVVWACGPSLGRDLV